MTAPYVRAPIPKDESLAELFHENTKIRAFMRDAEDDPAGASVELPPVASLVYAPEERLALPPPRVLARGLTEVIAARRSVRAFDGAGGLELDEVSTLFGHAYGATSEEGRSAPSAGGRYPLEFYLIPRNVHGLREDAAWHYVPEAHAVEPWSAPDAFTKASHALFDQPFLKDAAAIILVGAVFGRTMVKYRDRGYRLVLLDAGHAMQNILLAVEGLGLGAVSLGGFVDDELNALVGLDGIGENVVYVAAIGRFPVDG